VKVAYVKHRGEATPVGVPSTPSSWPPVRRQ
jgi:hypothetical protein